MEILPEKSQMTFLGQDPERSETTVGNKCLQQEF